MGSRKSTRIIASYVLSLLVTIALLVYWVVYVVSSMSTINELAARAGARGTGSHVLVLVVGCVLFVLVIGGLTYQLAQALGARNYSHRLDEFVSNITHEMKSPLAAIKLHAQTLQQPGVTADERQRSVGFILQQAERMGTLVDNVLESSRLIARKHSLSLEPMRLGPFLDSYFREQRGQVEARGVRLSVAVTTDAVVLATAEGLRRVMTNLIDNAVRFSARGGEVRCRVSDDRAQVTIEVEDDGVGIPRQELPKVFDRFYQIGRELSERRGGTGLGLSIVLGLVREMKGTVAALSHEGRPGTRFVVRLPVARRADMTAAARILVVEDEEAIADGIRVNLQRKHYQVTIASDGREALERLRERTFDLVILDVRLPEIDGFEVCQQLRRASDFTPILMLTARAQPDDVVYGLKLGADDYVTKPFDLAELLARVEGLLRRQAWARERQQAPGDADPIGDQRYAFGEFWIDFRTWEAQTRQGVVALSKKEINAMRLFVSRPNEVITRRELLADVWELPNHPNTRVVDNVLVALRRAFEDDALNPRHLLNVRGVGYRFVP